MGLVSIVNATVCKTKPIFAGLGHDKLSQILGMNIVWLWTLCGCNAQIAWQIGRYLAAMTKRRHPNFRAIRKPYIDLVCSRHYEVLLQKVLIQKQNSRHFADDTSKDISFNETIWIKKREICSLGTSWQHGNIDSNIGMAPKRQLTIIWNNVGIFILFYFKYIMFCWRIYASHGLIELSQIEAHLKSVSSDVIMITFKALDDTSRHGNIPTDSVAVVYYCLSWKWPVYESVDIRRTQSLGFYQHNETETKWSPFSRRQFEWKCMNFD